jgi:hypothetical protein
MEAVEETGQVGFGDAGAGVADFGGDSFRKSAGGDG